MDYLVSRKCKNSRLEILEMRGFTVLLLLTFTVAILNELSKLKILAGGCSRWKSWGTGNLEILTLICNHIREEILAVQYVPWCLFMCKNMGHVEAGGYSKGHRVRGRVHPTGHRSITEQNPDLCCLSIWISILCCTQL